MTLEEAKYMLMKEGFKLEGPVKPCEVSEFFIELESPEICEAMQIVCSAGYMIMMEVCDFNARKARLKEHLGDHSNSPTSVSPALEESASQFNDSLFEDQGKKIKHLTKKISRLNKIIHKKNLKIEEFRKESSRHLRGKIKMFVENEKLKKDLADKVVAEIDAHALKSAESALAYKEKLIAEKDDVISDLCNELASTKKELEEKSKLVEMVRKGSKEYFEYGIAAEKMILKLANVIVYEGKVSSKEFEEYRRLANVYRFNPQLYDFIDEDDKKLSPFKDDNSHGEVTNQKDVSPSLKVTVRLYGDDVRDLFKNIQHLW